MRPEYLEWLDITGFKSICYAIEDIFGFEKLPQVIVNEIHIFFEMKKYETIHPFKSFINKFKLVFKINHWIYVDALSDEEVDWDELSNDVEKLSEKYMGIGGSLLRWHISVESEKYW